ncbi:MAG: transposase [Verrucomicrobia bacterium]|nr:transposase [Verrucomicrobiota bacterium]
MNKTTSLESIHPTGEDGGGCSLDTLGGLVTVERTDEALTPYGGLAAWSAFVGRMGTFERLAERCPVERTSPNAAPVREVLHSFAVTALIEGRRFRHVGWVQDDLGIAAVLGLARVRGEDALPRLVRGLSAAEARTWLGTAETELYRALPERFIGDRDSTVNTRYGQQEGAEVGYNPFKRGRPSHHPLICVVAGTRLCLHMRWRPGKAVSATGWLEAMEQLWQPAEIRSRLWLNRGDTGFGQEAICAWHEVQGPARPKYLFKLRLTRNVRRAIANIRPEAWRGCPTLGTEQVAETSLQLEGWSRTRRVVIARTLKPVNSGPQEEFWATPEDEASAYVTNLRAEEASAEQVVLLQRKRGDAENVFDEVKNQWGFRGFCSRRGVVTEVAARLVWLTYNLWKLFVRLMGLEPEQHTEAVRSRRQFLVLAAQMSWSGRQRRWKLAVTSRWWHELKGCYQRLCRWLQATAPQLEKQRQFLRLLAFETPVDPGEWFGQTVQCPSG